MNLIDKRICVTGGAGFLGTHIIERLQTLGCKNIFVPRSSEFDLRTPAGVLAMYHTLEPNVVIHAAAHAGGIGLNQRKPADLFYDNIMMGVQMINQAVTSGVEKFVQIGTVCAYPKLTPTPFQEDNLWYGYPEETNAPYGIAKKALLVQGQAYRQQYGLNFIYLLPVNMYGPGDHFSLDSSHVVPALIRKFTEAKTQNLPSVTLWGTGNASREFLYVEDAAEAIILATENYEKSEPVNIGTGKEITICKLAAIIAEIVGYRGETVYDTNRPDGQQRRCLDTTRALAEFGFEAKTDFRSGLMRTIEWYNNQTKQLSAA
jgi:GDP-L-fucose synthase